MNNVKKSLIAILAIAGLCLIGTSSCKSKSDRKEIKTTSQAIVRTSLCDKELTEVKELVNGKWELVSGENPRETCEFENTFITFDGDKYIWTEEGKDEPGDLNWRKADTDAGYLMDVFYATNPSYPLAISGDTLFIQDCTETAYKYTLVRR
ncbi:hypothetical protein [uncultured Parabacteroides sp.]|uniref:hypothetical protein n=1 Tax=uncultured Parabacteroides sp. TaxID=512312 RepID=UPI002583DDEE|nr:hypothetical protein [uncultured Parabacteroides sp.]